MTQRSSPLVLAAAAAIAAAAGCASGDRAPARPAADARPAAQVAEVRPAPVAPEVRDVAAAPVVPPTPAAPSAPAVVAPTEAPAVAAGPHAAPAEVPALPALPGALPGDLVPAFKVTVRRPATPAVREEAFDSRAAGRPVVYIVTSTTCPYCRDYVERMKAIETRWEPRGVDVVHVYPNRSETVPEKVEWHTKMSFKGGQIIDADASIAKGLEADHTPTVYVVDKAGVIAYRGAIDDSPSGKAISANYVDAALEAVLAGKPVEVAQTDPPG